MGVLADESTGPSRSAHLVKRNAAQQRKTELNGCAMLMLPHFESVAELLSGRSPAAQDPGCGARRSLRSRRIPRTKHE
jgi:hypothetical protein